MSFSQLLPIGNNDSQVSHAKLWRYSNIQDQWPMATLFGGDLHAGLSGLKLDVDEFDLGANIKLRKTYACLFAPFMLMFEPPPLTHKSGKVANGQFGFSFEIEAELIVPSEIKQRYESNIEVAHAILLLFRLGANPAITMPAFANYPFTTMAHNQGAEARVLPYEIQPRYFPLGEIGKHVGEPALEWIMQRWPTVLKLRKQSPEFALAADALNAGQFLPNHAMTLLSLWSALEALFSPSTSELKFRISSLIAAYLEPPGPGRLERQKFIGKMYDKRSAAAHGKPNHSGPDLLAVFNLVREVLVRMIDAGVVPTKERLEVELFAPDSGRGPAKFE